MPTRNEIINTEITTDPLARGYAGLSSEKIRDDANTTYRVNAQGVWLSDLYQYLSHEMNDPGTGEEWPVLVMLKELAEENTVQGTPENDQFADKVAINLMGFIDKATDAGGQLIWLDFSKPAIEFTFDTLRNVGVISQVQRDAIENLSDVPQSRAAELGTGTWTTGDVVRNK